MNPHNVNYLQRKHISFLNLSISWERGKIAYYSTPTYFALGWTADYITISFPVNKPPQGE
jgi:hypothetical protein